MRVRFKRAISEAGEIVEIFRRVIRPIDRQKMIERDVENDSGKAPPRFHETIFSVQYNFVGVCKCVNASMHDNFIAHRVRKVAAADFSFDEIAQKRADDGFGRSFGEKKMGEIINRSLFY